MFPSWKALYQFVKEESIKNRVLPMPYLFIFKQKVAKKG